VRAFGIVGREDAMSATAGTLRVPHRHQSRAWLGIGAIVVFVAVTAAALVTFGGSEDATSTATRPSLWAGLDVDALEDLGYTGRAGASTVERIDPLFTEADRALMAAVAGGVVPPQALESEGFVMKRLVNQGLIPRESITP
jgi:hypothetical protein